MLAALLLLAAPAADPVTGVWEGSSKCQVKPSPCRNEHVIYRLTPRTPGRYRLEMYKWVVGVAEPLGEVQLAQNGNTLTGVMQDRQGRSGVWSFRVDGWRMSGRLTVEGGQVYRLIEVRKR